MSISIKIHFIFCQMIFFYPVGEFGLEDFRKFIAGIFTINQFSNEMVLCFKYSNRDLIDNEEVKELLIKNIYNKKEKYEGRIQT